MKKHNEITQQTNEWHEIKHAKIGGTLASGLHVKSNTLFYDILGELSEDYTPEDGGFINAAMQRGNDLEPVARQRLEAHLGVKFLEYGWLANGSLIGLSPDGLTEDDKTGCEIKCPSAKVHSKYVFENVFPKDYIHQMVHFFTVNEKLTSNYFCSFRPENKFHPLFVKEMTLKTVVNIGTEKRPKEVVIGDLVDEARKAAFDLEERLNEEIIKLNNF